MPYRIALLAVALFALSLALPATTAQTGSSAGHAFTSNSAPEDSHQGTGVSTAQGWKLKGTLVGHTEAVSSAAFFPDGRSILTSSGDGTIRVWDVTTSRQLKEVSVSESSVSDISVSPNGALVAACVDEEATPVVKIWDAATFKLLHTLPGHKDGVYAIAFSPDGQLLASGGRDTFIKLWNVRTGQLVRTLAGHTAAVTALAFTRDGKRLLSGSADGDKTVRLWQVVTGALLQTLSGHEDWVAAVAISPDATRLVTGSRDKNIILWNAITGAKLRTLKQSGMVFELDFSPDGKTLVQAGDEVRLYDARTWTSLGTLEGHSEQISDVKFSPSGTLVVTASYDKTAKVWERKRARR